MYLSTRPYKSKLKSVETIFNHLYRKDKDTIRKLTTENALEVSKSKFKELYTVGVPFPCLKSVLYPLQGLKKEFRATKFEWEMVEEVERPRIVSARAAPYDGKKLIAQIVLRMHTKQVSFYVH